MTQIDSIDTIVVPARPDGFHSVFVEKLEWPTLRIGSKKVEQVKYIAVYQVAPISAITHYAKITQYTRLEQKGRYKVSFEGPPIEITQVPYSPSKDSSVVQGPRYTSLAKILCSNCLTDVFY